jgi:Asp-tRNA(Asn)/Glu-tRNA(Gln) amidotransferase A subunit family amidase
MHLVERLEELLAEGRRVPLTSRVMIDQNYALDLIDQLRMTIPEEVQAARRVNAEIDRLLEQAREEAEHILARAQEQELTRQAEEMSLEIVRQARAEGETVKQGADDYAIEVLSKLEVEVIRTLKSIRIGLEILEERRDASAAAAEGDADTPVEAEGEFDESGQELAADTRR